MGYGFLFEVEAIHNRHSMADDNESNIGQNKLKMF